MAIMLFTCGCESDDSKEPGPASIAGTWNGYRSSANGIVVNKWQVILVLQQNGTTLSGTWRQGRGFGMSDIVSDVSGTYIQEESRAVINGKEYDVIDNDSLVFADKKGNRTELHRQ